MTKILFFFPFFHFSANFNTDVFRTYWDDNLYRRFAIRSTRSVSKGTLRRTFINDGGRVPYTASRKYAQNTNARSRRVDKVILPEGCFFFFLLEKTPTPGAVLPVAPSLTSRGNSKRFLAPKSYDVLKRSSRTGRGGFRIVCKRSRSKRIQMSTSTTVTAIAPRKVKKKKQNDMIITIETYTVHDSF